MDSELLNLTSIFFSTKPLLLFTLNLGLIIGFSILLLLLLFSALISGSEIAYFSLSPNDHERLESDELSSSKKIIWLIEQPNKLLATILISNNFINIAIILISEILVSQLFPHQKTEAWAQYWQENISWIAAYSSVSIATFIHFSITVIGVTFLLVLFGEVTPKVYASINSIRLARFMSTPLSLLLHFFSPISSLLVRWSTAFEKKLIATKAAFAPTSKEEIGKAIDIAVSHEENSEQDLDILKRIVNFSEVSVRQIMRSRVDVITIDQTDSFHKVLDLIKKSGYSRYPIYENDADNVIGILYSKDLITYLKETDSFSWNSFIRTNVLFVPLSKKIDDLLKDFQRERLHMAVVVDEYGGTSGIVTLEDVLEEIIGDIQDELDSKPEVVYKKIDTFNFVFDGKTMLNDVCRVVGIDTDSFDEIKGEAESIAGLILEYLGKMPVENQVESLGGFTFKALKVNRRRIEEVLLTLPSN